MHPLAGDPDALLEAILADPDEDAHRLAWADAVEADQPVRADLVRAQCREAAAPTHSRESREANQRVREMFRTHREFLEEEWRVLGIDPDHERGFVERLSGAPEVLARRSEGWPRAPLRTFALDVDTEEVGCDGVRALAASEALDGLEVLDLGSEGFLGPDGWAALLECEHLGSLRELSVSDDDSVPGVAEVIAARAPAGLRSLSFEGHMSAAMGQAGAEALAGSPRLAGLESLRLRDVNLNAGAARALAASPHLGRLGELQIGGGSYALNRIGPEGAEALAGSGALAGLWKLGLAFNGIGDPGARRLGDSRVLRGLVDLDLASNGITDSGLDRLLTGAFVPTLRVLAMAHNDLGPRALRHLNRVDPPGLDTLWLLGNAVGDEGLGELVRGPLPGRLRSLNLVDCDLTEAGIEALLEAAGEFVGLEYLAIGIGRRFEGLRDRLQEAFPRAWVV